MYAKIEKEYIFASIAEYPVCWVVIEPKDFVLRKGLARDKAFDEIGKLCNKLYPQAKSLAARTLNIPENDLDFLTIMSSGVLYEYHLQYRSIYYKEQAEQSLIAKGMSLEDILDGKDMMFTDHSGIFMPREK